MDNGQINGKNEVTLPPAEKMLDFFGHEIEFSIETVFHAIKNIALFQLSRRIILQSRIKNVLPKLRWNLILL